MRMTRTRLIAAALGLCALTTRGAFAGAHTWDVWEVFSDADGTVQFIELRETGGGAFETGVGTHTVTSDSGGSVTITSNVASPTSFKSILFGTAAYDALPNSPTPDYVIPANFFAIDGDTVHYNPYDALSFPAGVPTDGILSLNRDLTTGVNSPTNYAGQTGSINAAPAPTPPGVPDGRAGSVPMTVTAADATGSSLTLNWGTTCAGAARFHIVYGSRSDLPAAPGGIFNVDGGTCGIGATMPFVWNQVPADTDGSGLLWWLILSDDGAAVEGSWGKGTNGLERAGPGSGGVSGVCGMATKSVTNVCGQ